MKKLLAILMLIFTMLGCGGAMAYEEYPEDNYKMYYEGNRAYPIAYATMGYGYVLDRFSLDSYEGDEKCLVCDVHEVNMATNRMLPNPMHVYAEYKPKKGSFAIGFQESYSGAIPKPQDMHYFDASSLNKDNASTGLLFAVGRMMYEAYHHEPLYKNWPLLKPVGESGAPSLIQVNENTFYGRTGLNTAVIEMRKSSGIEFYSVTFHPKHFLISQISAENKEIEEYLTKTEVGRPMYYEDNPRVNLVRNYMGLGLPLSKEQLAAVGVK